MEGLSNRGNSILFQPQQHEEPQQTEALDLSKNACLKRKVSFGEPSPSLTVAKPEVVHKKFIAEGQPSAQPSAQQVLVVRPSTSTSKIDQPSSSSAVATKFIDRNKAVADVISYRKEPMSKISPNREVALSIQDTRIRKDKLKILAHILELKQIISKGNPNLDDVICNAIEDNVSTALLKIPESKLYDIFDIQSILPFLFYKKDSKDLEKQTNFNANLSFILFESWKKTPHSVISRKVNGLVHPSTINRFIKALQIIKVDEYLLLSVYYKAGGETSEFYPDEIQYCDYQKVIKLFQSLEIDRILAPYITKEIKELTDQYHINLSAKIKK